LGFRQLTYSELQFGVANSSAPEQNRIALVEFIAPLEVADYTMDIAEIYGSIRSSLKRKGRLIRPLDLLIAAHSLYLETTLVTNNVREFARIPGLKLENWAQ